MPLLATIIITLVAVFHLYILYFEMFARERRGPKVLRQFPKEMFPTTKAMAANQGLYNGFLAAGLIWSLLIQDPAWQKHVAFFFLGCVAVAGVFGAVTASKRILYVQALPAFLGIAALLFL